MIIQNENICREKYFPVTYFNMTLCMLNKKIYRILSVPERTGEMARFSIFPVCQTGCHKTEFELPCGFNFLSVCMLLLRYVFFRNSS